MKSQWTAKSKPYRPTVLLRPPDPGDPQCKAQLAVAGHTPLGIHFHTSFGPRQWFTADGRMPVILDRLLQELDGRSPEATEVL